MAEVIITYCIRIFVSIVLSVSNSYIEGTSFFSNKCIENAALDHFSSWEYTNTTNNAHKSLGYYMIENKVVTRLLRSYLGPIKVQLMLGHKFRKLLIQHARTNRSIFHLFDGAHVFVWFPLTVSHQWSIVYRTVRLHLTRRQVVAYNNV